MSAGARLSGETIESIIALLSSNFDALKSCSLVSRAFCPPTRPFLFHTIRGIYIKLESSTDSMDALQSISSHVRVIRLSNDDLYTDLMPRTISNLDCLHTIIILGYVDWSSLSEEMVTALSSRATITSLELYSIAFEDVDHFGHLIWSFPSLISLILFDIRSHNSISKKLDVCTESKPEVEHLTVYGSAILPMFLTPTTSPISLQRLKKFTMMEVFAVDFVGVAALMNVAPRLRELHFRSMQKDIVWRAPDPLDLFGVEIISLILHDSEADGESLHYVSPELILRWWLRSFESGLELKSVTLKIFIQSRANPLLNVNLWENFDTAMGELWALKDVNVVIRGPESCRKMLGKLIEEHCNGLYSSNVLKIDTRR
ncbi:uncharacterized protein EV420DRAFT_513042 [Desarmillaria tabescens]|uniref:Uncharacterized protein n=1 Tax=Armillaria tabescens TaxID=1929756 RepID=A0AA39N4J4_ARMTA|nr:uncharacterized protein EV420DRAFT_513042 [Desarmillaria tabescens]KAK0457203.1 hypothetical protein EV420DRAFT_513042 [Desarmillaria tabescens]